MTTETSGSGDVARSLELLWGTAEHPSRGPKPGLTLDRIVSTAIEIADAEGLAAVSMRRLSTELGTGTMSLYRYIPGKAELLDLMLDRVSDFGPWEPGPEKIGWRQGVEEIARGYLLLYRAHPWLLRVNQSRTVLGPSTVRAMETALTLLQDMRLSDPEMISVIITTHSFVMGIARIEAEAAEAVEATGQSVEEFWESQGPFLEQAMTSGAYPLTAGLSAEAFGPEFDHFEFGLETLLDGLEARVRRRAERAGGAVGPPGGPAGAEPGTGRTARGRATAREDR
ncbi:TetR/AcrR family transcriptional regulator [Streptomyces jumonjinensis]